MCDQSQKSFWDTFSIRLCARTPTNGSSIIKRICARIYRIASLKLVHFNASLMHLNAFSRWNTRAVGSLAK